MRSSASTRPAASSSGACSAPTGAAPSITRASASATGRSATSASLGAIHARLPAALLDEMNALDAHAALGRLHHVVNGEARDRNGGQRFHLDAGLTFQLAGRPHHQARQLFVRLDIHLDLAE